MQVKSSEVKRQACFHWRACSYWRGRCGSKLGPDQKEPNRGETTLCLLIRCVQLCAWVAFIGTHTLVLLARKIASIFLVTYPTGFDIDLFLWRLERAQRGLGVARVQTPLHHQWYNGERLMNSLRFIHSNLDMFNNTPALNGKGT